MKAVYKYQLSAGLTVIEMPAQAQVLTAQFQRADLCLWALVDPSMPKTKRTFHVYGTGHEIDSDQRLKYIGTVQMAQGSLIFHIFEV